MELLEAIILCDEARVRKMLPFYMNAAAQLDDGLIHAVMLGMPNMAELLLKAGANPDVRTPPRDREAEAASVSRAPPDVQAERKAAYEEFKKANPRLFGEYAEYTNLLVHTNDPDDYDADLGTALIHVCQGTFSIVEPSIVSGDATYDPAQRHSWLDRAQSIQSELSEKLIAAGADLEARDTIGRTPLLAVAYADDVGIKLACPDGFYALGPLPPRPIIERLLAAGADVNARDVADNTMLMLMAQEDIGIVKLLMDAGASVDGQNRHGYSALLFAASDGNAAVVRLLLDAGVEVDLRDENDFTPLHHAVHFASSRSPTHLASTIETVRMLIAAGADVNARGARGRTPLHLGAAEGVVGELLDTLIEAGAVPDSVDELGSTPYDLAVHQGNEHLIPMLRRAFRTV